MTHEIRCWPEYYEALLSHIKEFEVRINDRDYQVGDTLLIKEWNAKTQKYTNRLLIRKITYILQGVHGLPKNICVMQLR